MEMNLEGKLIKLKQMELKPYMEGGNKERKTLVNWIELKP